MTTKQILFSALIFSAMSNVGLATQETSTNSHHKILNNIPVFTNIGHGIFLEESTSQVTYTKAYYPDSSNEFRKLFENGLNGVMCNDGCFLIVNSNQKSDCDLVIDRENTLLREKKQSLNYFKKEIHNLENKLATETNNIKRQEIIEDLTLCNKSYGEIKEQVKLLKKTINAMNGTKK